jgi:hypothetical protein
VIEKEERVVTKGWEIAGCFLLVLLSREGGGGKERRRGRDKKTLE